MEVNTGGNLSGNTCVQPWLWISKEHFYESVVKLTYVGSAFSTVKFHFTQDPGIIVSWSKTAIRVLYISRGEHDIFCDLEEMPVVPTDRTGDSAVGWWFDRITHITVFFPGGLFCFLTISVHFWRLTCLAAINPVFCASQPELQTAFLYISHAVAETMVLKPYPRGLLLCISGKPADRTIRVKYASLKE